MVWVLEYEGREITRQSYEPTRNVGVPQPDGSNVWIRPDDSRHWRTEPDPLPPPGPTPAEVAAQQAAAANKRFRRLRKARDTSELVTAIEALLTGDGL